MFETLKSVSANRMLRQEVLNLQGEHLGEIQEIMIDLDYGYIAYAALSFGGGFDGLGNKLFAVPWTMLRLLEPDSYHEGHFDRKFILNVPKEKLKNAPGFDKNHWPDPVDHVWLNEVYVYYGCQPYWSS